MKSKKVIAALCALAMVVSSSEGLPFLGVGMFDTAITASAVDYVSDSRDYWAKTTCVDESGNQVAPSINFTFNEDKTKLLKIDFSGLYTNADNIDYEWWGTGIGINESPDRYVNAYVFKNRTTGSITDSSNTYFNDVFDLWSFTSNNILDKSSNSVKLYKNSSNKAVLSASYTLSDEDNEKLDPNKTYYVHVILQGWGGMGSRWGTITPVTFNLSEVATYGITYDGNGNTGGTVPTDTNVYSSSASASVLGNAGNLEKPGHIFNGWNTEPDGSGTQYSEGDTFEISDNTTLYAQWVPKPLVHYQLWITGNEVTSENLSGDGWSYDAETNTLTLNNYSFTGVGTVYAGGRGIDPTVIFYDPKNGATFNIVLEGENNIVSESKNGGTVWGIYSRSDFTISGSGTLNVSTADGARRASAIYSEKNLEIKSGTLNASSGTVTAGPQGSGIEGPDSTVVTIGEDAVVTASGYNAAIKANVRNAIEGTGWNDKDGTDGKTNIDVSASGQNIGGFKRVQFPAVPNDPVYTVTIPADVDMASGSATANVSADYEVYDKTLSVTVTSENGYKLKADYNDVVTIPYKVTCGDSRILSSDDNEVLSVTGEGSVSEILSFLIDPDDMYAGDYKDILTFNISLS